MTPNKPQASAERSVKAAAVETAACAGATNPLVTTTTRTEGSLKRVLAKAVGAPGVERISQLPRPLRKAPQGQAARERTN